MVDADRNAVRSLTANDVSREVPGFRGKASGSITGDDTLVDIDALIDAQRQLQDQKALPHFDPLPSAFNFPDEEPKRTSAGAFPPLTLDNEPLDGLLEADDPLDPARD